MKVFVLIIMAVFSITASANDMSSLLKQYSWYDGVKEHRDTISNTKYSDFNVRADVVNYLEHNKLYQAVDTDYCNDNVNDEFHDENLDTCYIGTAKQNAYLLRALKSSKVQNHLSKVSAYDIVNGTDKVFLNQTKETLKKFCTPKYTSISNVCEVYHNVVKSMENTSH